MTEKKSRRGIMNLTKEECIPVAKQILHNSNEMLNDGKALSENHSYGRATSLLILSMEESVKAFILFLDGNGFEFRFRIKGIKNLFTNHQLRYPVALMVSAFNIFKLDLQRFMDEMRNNPHFTPQNIKENENEWMQRMQKYIIEKVEQITIEINWFTSAEFISQKGMYVDYDNELKTPLDIKEQDYNEVLDRVETINEFINNFIEGFDWEHKGKFPMKEQFNRFHHELIEKNGYQALSLAVSKFGNKTNPMKDLIDKLNDAKTDMINYPFSFEDNNILLNSNTQKRKPEKTARRRLE